MILSMQNLYQFYELNSWVPGALRLGPGALDKVFDIINSKKNTSK